MKKKFFTLCAVLTICALGYSPAARVPLPAEAADFETAVTLPGDAQGGWETADHKLNDGGTTITMTGEYTLSGNISGSGGLTINSDNSDGSRLTLAGKNTYTGGTVLNDGALFIGSDRALGEGALTLKLERQNTTLGFAGSHTIDNAISLKKTGSGTTAAIFDIGGEHSATITGGIKDISGSGLAAALTKFGTGTLTLYGKSDYEGKTTVHEGTLRAGADGAFDTGSYAVAGGTLDLNGHDLTMLALEGKRGGIIALGTAKLTVNQDGYADTTSSVIISGSGSLTKQGGSTVVLEGNSTYSGGTRLEGGTLDIAHDNGLGTGALIMSGGTTLSFNTRGDISVANNISLAGITTFDTSKNRDATITGSIDGSGSLTKTGQNKLTLTRDLAGLDGGVKVDNGTLLLDFDGDCLFKNPLTGGGTLAFDLGGGELSFADSAGGDFVGTVELSNTKLTMDAAAARVLANATLKLGGEYTLFFDLTQKSPNTNVPLLTLPDGTDIEGAAVSLNTPSGLKVGDKFILAKGTANFNGPTDVTSANGDAYTIQQEGDTLTAVLKSLAPPLSGETTPKEVSVTIGGETINARIKWNGTYLLTVPIGTDISRLAVKIVPPPGAAVEPDSGSEQDFSNGPVSYTITAENGAWKVYKVSAQTETPPEDNRRGGGCDAGAGMAALAALAARGLLKARK